MKFANRPSFLRLLLPVNFMNNELEITLFLELARTIPVIDVRSPGEFERGHIPGAHNLPLFDNAERAKIGTLYKQKGREEAVLAGLEIVGPKMSGFVQRSRELSKNNEVLVHCWRGGMRSGSFCWLLNMAGIKARTLKRGYKAYRNEVQSSFKNKAKLIVVGGETGSGKTDILKSIREKGEQVIDLEGYANHKGSSFGAMGQDPQPVTELFENKLHAQWSRLDLSKRIWVEDESKSIGRVFIPEGLWSQMKAAPVLRIKLPKSERIKRLVREYGTFEKKDLGAAIERIEKRLGGLAYKQAMEALNDSDLATVADLTLTYYDKAYNFPHEKRKFEGVHVVESDKDDADANAAKLIAAADEKLVG